MALVSYGSGSESENSENEDTIAKPFPASKSKNEGLFENDEMFDEDKDSKKGPGLILEQADVLEEVVKPKAWEKELAEKERLRKEKKAKKKEKKRARKEAEEKREEKIKKTDAPNPRKRVQIQLFGALNAIADPGSDSDEDTNKPGPSSGPALPGAKGLLGMLPAPKIQSIKPSSGKTGIMLPATLRTAMTKKVPEKVHATGMKPTNNKEDSGSDDDTADYFGLASSEPASKVPRIEDNYYHNIPIMPTDGNDFIVGPSQPDDNEYVHPSEMYNMAGVEKEGKRKGIISDAEAHRMIMERETDFNGMGVADIVNNIQDFSVQQALGPGVKESLLRNLTKATTQKSSVPLPKAATERDLNAKRKNQITYLAQIAVSRQTQLQEAQAEAKHNKRMAKQKYGF